MSATQPYPGTPRHQALLSAVAGHYASDPRVLAAGVFGSLGRGNWDEYSDLDLDVILADDVRLDLPAELQALCAALAAVGEPALLVIPDGDEEGDIVLRSLGQLSIRYHTLESTSPAIIDTLQLIAGRLDRRAIVAAGQANDRPPAQPLEGLLQRCLRDALGVQIALQRRQPWLAVELLQRMRQRLMELFTRVHGGQRAWQTFQAQASRELQVRLGATLPGYEPASLHSALLAFLDLLQNHLGELTAGQLTLSSAQVEFLETIRSILPAVTTPQAAQATVLAFNDALNARDLDQMMRLMTADCVFENTYPPPDGERFVGQQAVRSFWQAFFDSSAAARIEPEEIFTAGECCTMLWTYRWSDEHGAAGHIRGVDVYTIRDGLIAEKRSYVKG